MRTRRVFWVALAWILMSVGGCKSHPKATGQDKLKNVVREPRMQGDVPPTVMFDIIPIPKSGGNPDWHSYDCFYKAGGKMAKFRLEWRQKGPMTSDDQFPVAPAEGRFIAVAGSDNSALLTDLKKALDAKQVPSKAVRTSEVTFSAVILAEHQGRGPSGEFFERPPGDWELLKLFFPEGGDDGEVFLNLNPVTGKAEFSVKDSDYGDYLLAQFAKVL